MNISEYKSKIRSELIKFRCLGPVRTRNNGFILYKSENKTDINEFIEYIKNNNNKLQVIDETQDYIEIEILDLDKYKEPKTELDIEIEKLEEKLKQLKEKKKNERKNKEKQDKIRRLKEELKRLEEN